MVKWELRGVKAHREIGEQQGREVFRDLRVSKVLEVRPVQLETRGRKAHRDFRVILVLKVLEAYGGGSLIMRNITL